MEYALLAVSVLTGVVYNALLNFEGKHGGRRGRELYLFNAFVYGVGFLFLLGKMISEPVSLFSIGFGVLFGIVTVCLSIGKLKALANGPMHVTVLIITASMVLPALSGVWINGDTVSIPKLCVMAVLLFFLYLSLERSPDTGISRTWFFCVLIAFFCQAGIGIMQKLHQASAHAAESSGFLAAAFFCSALFSLIAARIPGKDGQGEKQPLPRLQRRTILIAAVCGVCIFLLNDLNLKLAGILPGELFFPIQNGGTLVLNALTAVLVFREPMTSRQRIGLLGGIVSLILICLL